MTRPVAVAFVRAAVQRVLALTALMVLVMGAFASSNAHAQAVDRLAKDLEADSERVRLSAALNLTKLGDPKAILPLAKALGNDNDAKVRSAAAVGLGKLVAGSTNKSVNNLAISALKKAAAEDPSALVKAQADTALKALGAAGGAPPPPSGGGGGKNIYVNIGPMAAKTGDAADGKLKTLMQKTAKSTLGRVAKAMATDWSAGGTPTQSQLTAKGFTGFYVDGTLNELKVTTSGSTATISCKISMLVASFPDKSMFAFLNGGAKVQGSSSPSDIAMGGEDCVAAVVEDLIAKKIVPTIQSKVP
ncbi:MAG: HEAT repeat domain-containing protein [Kofleriaceae bacterium]|nr:HEAT repeat domain-containing protein [Kofleriaceae bacterium]